MPSDERLKKHQRNLDRELKYWNLVYQRSKLLPYQSKATDIYQFCFNEFEKDYTSAGRINQSSSISFALCKRRAQKRKIVARTHIAVRVALVAITNDGDGRPMAIFILCLII